LKGDPLSAHHNIVGGGVMLHLLARIKMVSTRWRLDLHTNPCLPAIPGQRGIAHVHIVAGLQFLKHTNPIALTFQKQTPERFGMFIELGGAKKGGDLFLSTLHDLSGDIS